MRDQDGTQQALGFLRNVLDRLDHLDAAGLAAATGMNLSLHHPHRPAELVRRLVGFFDRERRYALRHRHAKFTQDCLGLIFVDVHAASF